VFVLRQGTLVLRPPVERREFGTLLQLVKPEHDQWGPLSPCCSKQVQEASTKEKWKGLRHKRLMLDIDDLYESLSLDIATRQQIQTVSLLPDRPNSQTSWKEHKHFHLTQQNTLVLT
jgi:hypothetical protein